MSKRLLLAIVIVAVAAGLALLRPWDQPASNEEIQHDPFAAVHKQGTPAASPSVATQLSKPRAVTKKKKNVTKEERARYRRAIRDAIDRRASAPAPDAPAAAPTPDSDGSAPSEDTLKDRSEGKLTGLMKDFQQDVMPLADECYELALERDPELAGGLDLQFEIIGDQDLGGLVERVDVEEGSEIQDAEMIECMRETLLSTIFPAPDDSGSAGVRLTLRFDPSDAGGRE